MTEVRKLFDFAEFKPSELPADCCPECGGQGEIIYGDGGGDGGRATETGFAEECRECGGEGIKGLIYTARQAIKPAKTGDST